MLSPLVLLPLLPALFASPLSSPRPRSSSVLNSTYVNPTFSQSLHNIDSYAVKSIQYLLSLPNNTAEGQPGGWVGQNGYTAIAQWDYQQKTRTFYEAVKSAEDEYATNPGGCYSDWGIEVVDCYNDDAGWAGLASLQAWEAYGDEEFLTRAKGVFDFVTAHGYIFESDIEAGYLVGTKYKNNTLLGTCHGQSMKSGVYWQNGAPTDPTQIGASSDDNVNAVSTGLYGLLGAELCRVTANMTYCDMAYASMQWIDTFLKSPDGLVYDHLNGSSCEVTEWIFTYNAALYIAAYASLSNTTDNSTALHLSESCAKASLTTPQWNNAQGVIIEGLGNVTASDDGIGFKAVLIRYLNKYSSLMSKDMQSAIRQYINIQYWSITNYDSDNACKPVEYGRNWTGVFEVATGQSQITALDVLNGLILNPHSAFPNTTKTSVPVAKIK